MGQQQLILLVLATVIVGVAIVVGIRAFSENSARSNADQMTQTAVRIANDAQAWKKKPAPFGGQASLSTTDAAEAGNFTGATFSLLGMGETGGVYSTIDGTYKLAASSDSLVVTGVNTAENNQITVSVTGPSDTDISGTVVCLGGVDPASGTSCTAVLP